MAANTALDSTALAAVELRLAATDKLLAKNYPGDDGRRQPIHTAYVPADRYTPELPAQWGADALEAAGGVSGLESLANTLGLKDAGRLAELVASKLETEPIEDLRLDFEDGFGHRSDEEEDQWAARAAQNVVAAVNSAVAPPFIGIRFKCFEAPTRSRAVRTLDIFISELAAHGPLPTGLVLTLPKVTTVAQVETMVYICENLERAHSWAPRTLKFEVQMETPQLILSHEGIVPSAVLLHAGDGRITSLHYGTYDYSASLGIAAAYQSMEHPAADYAKNVMQVAIAETGVHMSDGSTNILPLGDAESVQAAWALHARLVRRHLERGIYQGWDLHQNQLVTRYLASYAFYREGFDAAARRLRNYVHKIESAIMDEPATAKALGNFIRRGLICGALGAEEIIEHAGISIETLESIALAREIKKEDAHV